MVEAERRGRLFGLAGDVLQWSGRPIYSLRTAAEALGVPVDDVAHAWAVLGLTVAEPGRSALSQADVDGLATWVALKTSWARTRALSFLRVLGAAMARLAEASRDDGPRRRARHLMTHSRDELATARAYRAVAELVPAHRDADRLRVASSPDQRPDLLRGRHPRLVGKRHVRVGFADLSGFTTLTQLLTPTELSDLLIEFSGTVSDVVHADGGRVVKFIGDEVMWVELDAGAVGAR